MSDGIKEYMFLVITIDNDNNNNNETQWSDFQNWDDNATFSSSNITQLTFQGKDTRLASILDGNNITG